MNERTLQLWALPNAGEELHCSVGTLRAYIRRGELRALLVGGRYMIENAELMAFLERRKGVSAKCGRKKAGDQKC